MSRILNRIIDATLTLLLLIAVLAIVASPFAIIYTAVQAWRYW